MDIIFPINPTSRQRELIFSSSLLCSLFASLEIKAFFAEHQHFRAIFPEGVSSDTESFVDETDEVYTEAKRTVNQIHKDLEQHRQQICKSLGLLSQSDSVKLVPKSGRRDLIMIEVPVGICESNPHVFKDMDLCNSTKV